MQILVKKYRSMTDANPNISSIILTLLLLIFLIILFSSLSPLFLTKFNMFNLLNQVSIYVILCVGMTLVMATGEIDISIGTMSGLTVFIFAMFILGYGFPWWVGILVCLLAGALCGVFNGFIVSKFNVPSIVVTLGSLAIFMGLAYAYAGRDTYFRGFPEEILIIARGRILGIHLPVYIALAVFLIGSYFLSKTTTGKYLIATGADSNAASLSGIKTGLIKFLPFLIMGILVSIASIITAARMDVVTAATGQGKELHVIAAVVLGGTTITGGKAFMSGTLLGVLILGVLENGLVILSVSAFWQMFAIGLIFIAVVVIRSWREKALST